MILAGNERVKFVDVRGGYDDAVKRKVHRCLTGFEPIIFALLFWICFYYYYSVTLEEVSSISPKLVLIKKSIPMRFTFLISIAVMFSTFLCFSLTATAEKRTAGQENEEVYDQLRDLPATSTDQEKILGSNRQIKSVRLNFLNENFSCSKPAVVHIYVVNNMTLMAAQNTKKSVNFMLQNRSLNK